MFFIAVTRALVYVYGVCWYIVARRTAPAHIVSLPGPENLIPGTSPALLERQVNGSNGGSSPHFRKTYQYKLVKQRKTNHVF